MVPKLPIMLATSNDTRIGTMNALAVQYQRMAQAVPIWSNQVPAPWSTRHLPTRDAYGSRLHRLLPYNTRPLYGPPEPNEVCVMESGSEHEYVDGRYDRRMPLYEYECRLDVYWCTICGFQESCCCFYINSQCSTKVCWGQRKSKWQSFIDWAIWSEEQMLGSCRYCLLSRIVRNGELGMTREDFSKYDAEYGGLL